MTKQEFLKQLDDVMELAPGSIKGAENLVDLPKWDSLAQISFIAMVDKHLQQRVSGKDLLSARTVMDLVLLAGPKIQG